MTRWTFRILLCLLLGAVTTVGVAWWFAFVFHQNSRNQVASGRTGSLETGWYVQVFERPGFAVLRAAPLSQLVQHGEDHDLYPMFISDNESIGLNWRKRDLLGDSAELLWQGPDPPRYSGAGAHRVVRSTG